MSDIIVKAKPASSNFHISEIEISQLVGKAVTVYSRQNPGKPISSHVLATSKDKLRLSTDGPASQLLNLVSSQKVIIQIPYRGEWLSVNARLKKTDGGQCGFHFEGPVVPLSQRKFVRVNCSYPVTLAAFTHQTLAKRSLNHLRWVRTETINFSSGGALVQVPGHLDGGLYLLMSIEVDIHGFPAMVLGQVRYCYLDENKQPRAGIEFVVRELAEKKYSRTVIKRLPEAVMAYTAPIREKINRIIQTGSNQRTGNTGV